MLKTYFGISLFVVSTIKCSIIKENNACKSFQDYFYAQSSENCFYNPDLHLETPELIEKHAGEVQEYKFPTSDGYILTMFRIPRRNPKGVILLQHPLFVDSRIWVALGNESIGKFPRDLRNWIFLIIIYYILLALHLWNAGYDVWLNNNRGTFFSKGHKTLKSSDLRYWDFSFHEFGVYEIPSQLNIIKKHSGDLKIVYVGYSMGSTSALIFSSLYPEQAKYFIKTFVLMVTPCYFKHSFNPLVLISTFEPILKSVLENYITFVFWLMRLITATFTRLFPAMLWIINVIISYSSGWCETDPTVLNFDSGIYLRYFSWKTVLHYMQLMSNRDQFRMFNYGKMKNLKLYNSQIPPLYPIERMIVPIILISGMNDNLVKIQDSDLLFERLPRKVKIREHLKLSGLNHVSFFIGKQRKKMYADLLNVLDNISASVFE